MLIYKLKKELPPCQKGARCISFKIDLMPNNNEAFEVVQYCLAGSKWEKGTDEIYRVQYNPAEVATVMQGLEIKSGSIFKQVVGCLSTLTQEYL